MHNKRSRHAAAALGNNIYVAGGVEESTAECYNVKTQQWNEIKSMSTERQAAAAVSLGNSIVVMGGYNATCGSLSSAEHYSTTSRQWSGFPSMNEARIGCAAAILSEKIFVVGGEDRNIGEALRSGEEYDPNTGVWSSIPPMHHKRAYCAAAVLDSQIYVVGGYNGNERLSSIEVYNPTTRCWSLLSNMNLKRSSCAAVSLHGKLIVVGGYDEGGKHLAVCEAYDPTTCQWSSIPTMQTGRCGCAAVAVEVDGTLYVMGGRAISANEDQHLESIKLQQKMVKRYNNKMNKVGMASAVLNVATLGIAGTLFEAAMVPTISDVIDFGDISNKQTTMGVIRDNDGNDLSSMETLKILPRPQQCSSNNFVVKLFEKDDRNVLFKCEELMNIVEDVHQMKFLYTYTNSSYRMKTITQEDRKRYITGSLEKVASSTTCREAIAIFKQILDKAKQDGIINDHEYYSVESKAVVAHVGAAPFVKEIWESIHNIQTRVVTLENRVDVLDSKVKSLEQVSTNIVESLSMLQKGIRRKQKIEAVTGLMSAVLNGISLGIAGSVAQGVMASAIGNIVDFGDISHIQTVIKSFDDVRVQEAFQSGIDVVCNATVEEAFQTGIDYVANSADNSLYTASKRSRTKLHNDFMAAADEGNLLFPIVVAAQLIAQAETGQLIAQAETGAGEIPVIPPQQSSIVSRLDVLEEVAGIKKDSPMIKKRVEALEMNIFGDPQEGAMKERISKLEFEIL